MNKGIAIAGSIIVDLLKTIERYPKQGNLASITSLTRSSGGIVPNTLIDLKRIDPDVPYKAIGLVGDDDNGHFACSVLKENGINTDFVGFSKKSPTATTDVMAEPSGVRTFFCINGACDELNADMITALDFEADIFHLGYALLLNGMDAYDEEYGTQMARTLAAVRRRGIKTSMDIVSRANDRAQQIILSSAKQCDYFIVNEIELELATDITVRTAEGGINHEAVEKACSKMFDEGVHEWVIIHAPEGAWAMDTDRNFTFVPSLKLPEGFIKGGVGAGDAFCAGTLYGLYKGWDIKDILVFGSGAAAACLSEMNAIDGMRSKEDIYKLIDMYKRF